MKMKYLLFVLLFLILNVQSCTNKRHRQVFTIGQTIQVLFTPGEFPPIESYISQIRIVPLETGDDCLIGNHIFSVKVNKDLIYINSDWKHIFVFDMNGKFIREIGSIGQGPGELLEMRDFLFTGDGTIEILDFQKIESYTLEGKHIRTVKRFNYLGEDFYCNPTNFCQSFSSGYFLWGGTVGPRDVKLRERSYYMYRVNSDMQVENGYFNKKYGDGGIRDRIKYYQDYTLVTPSSFDYNIYQIDSDDSIRIRYTFDFGKYGFDSSKDTDREYADYENNVRGISHYFETDRFFGFNFAYQTYLHSLIYSKVTRQTFIKSLQFSYNNKDFKLHPVDAVYNDRLISIISVDRLKLGFEYMSAENIRKWGLDEYQNIDDEENPVMIFYTMKID